MKNRKLTIQEMNRLTPAQFHESEKIPLVVVLDNVRSRHNIGAVFRTADAFRIAGVWLCGCCATPPDAEIHKTALGAEDTVSWQYTEDTKQAVAQLKQEGYIVYAVEQTEGSIMLDQLNVGSMAANGCDSLHRPKVAIVLGLEVFGVQQEVINLCHGCIEIPQYGTKHSLNVSVAAGIVMYVISLRLKVDSL